MTTRARLASVLIVGAALVAAGCSSDGSAPGSASSTTTTSARPPTDPADVAAQRSAGCDGAAAEATAGRTKQTLTSGGEERWYYRDIPPVTAAAAGPLPVVFDLHGYSEGADVHLQMSNLTKLGAEKGFVTITPQGTGPVARWENTIGSKDETFFGEMLDQVEADLCVDTNRVYVTGLSNGAFMTSAIACQFSDRVAAVAPVAGVRDIEKCAPKRAVPIVAFHGTADGFVAYDGGFGEQALDLPAPDGSGKKLRDTLTPAQIKAGGGDSVPTIMAAWAKRNGCTKTTRDESVAADVTKIAWACPAGRDATLYRVTDGGHTWPGSAFSQAVESVVGHTTTNIDANTLMWDFFVAHPLVRR